MKIIWGQVSASVNDVLDAWTDLPTPAYNTVLTIMRILERKGYLKHVKKGRAFVYQPVINQTSARQKAVSQMVKSFFDGSPELLVLSLMQDSQLSPEDINRIEKMLEEKEREG
jgi:predicted transcriptional regulator